MTTKVVFLKQHTIGPFDFPGAIAVQGIYPANGEGVGLPDDQAASFIASGIASAYTGPSASAQSARLETWTAVTFTAAAQDALGTTYAIGDKVVFPKPVATAYVAAGYATLTTIFPGGLGGGTADILSSPYVTPKGGTVGMVSGPVTCKITADTVGPLHGGDVVGFTMREANALVFAGKAVFTGVLAGVRASVPG